jgi:hypothetical protein
MNDNIENKIKQEFQNRTIEPSKNAWEKLESKMTIQKVKKEKNRYRFLAYAAIFIGLLFGLLLFLKNGNIKNNNIENPIVIDNNNTEQVKKDEEILKNNVEQNESIVDKEEVIVKNNLNNKPNVIRKKIQKVIHENFISKDAVAQVTKNKSDKEKEIKIDSKIIGTEYTSNKIDIVQSVVNQNNSDSTKKNNTNKIVVKKVTKIIIVTTDNDINSLLASAMNEVKQENDYELMVNSNSLQYAVESELNKPLTNKIFKTLKAGVDTVEAIIVSNNN